VKREEDEIKINKKIKIKRRKEYYAWL